MSLYPLDSAEAEGHSLFFRNYESGSMQDHATAAQVLCCFKWQCAGHVDSYTQVSEDVTELFRQFNNRAIRSAVAFAADAVEMALVFASFSYRHRDAHRSRAIIRLQ